MGDRPTDWYPLVQFGGDPIPGDWELVQEAAARYRRTADAIERARTLLREVTDSRDGWRSEAGEAFREKATELSDDVFKAHGRYDAAANALAGYWPELQDAQEESLELRRQAIEAQDEIDRLARRVEAAEDKDSETHDDQDRLQDDLETAEGDLQRLRDRLIQVVEDKDAAAQRAADAIGEFIGSDGLKDGFWDSVTDAVGDALSRVRDALIAIGNIAGWIATVASVIALAVGWIPVIGQPIAAVLGTVALVATVFSLVGNILEKDGLGIVLDLIGIVTFGIGRAAGRLARTSGARSGFRAFKSLLRQMQFGNRAARRARAEGILRQSAHRLWQASENAARFTRPSSLRGWARFAYTDGIGSELAESFRDLRNVRWDQVRSGLQGLRDGDLMSGGWRAGIQATISQIHGAHDAAQEATSLARAAAENSDLSYLGLGADSGVELASQVVGTASGVVGTLLGVRGEGWTATFLPSFSLGRGDT